ncbi:DNA-binding response regulator in two-component regulatory system with CpxA [Canicola haemoglobinophilus]|uniref:DNA-binding response regulator in two-component regulatory system with CpxA n=1 Tax=Canicola haemoglobinophilus TaxID=733 RepID=A0AB38H5Z6_9PAST|nr:response regulator [Canicola haemoglobinophilus]STO54573.1 DNA-binding response regulator in two-component regulatory system with CpxA [Canicola haemoglobinophilus]STO67652.1 DNA-binding response regulator in two-component regulatory system with CpxA [Canicola haemoglobinophilus]
MTKLLIVDDDKELVDLLSELLAYEGFDIDTAMNGLEALEKLDQSHDLVLLDVMMPKLNGFETLKKIRQQSDTPVIMLTARGEDIDRVVGLELGADDYLPKPFNDRELLARIRAILRRTKQDKETSYYEAYGLTLDLEKMEAYFNGENLNLTGTEFSLLQILMQNPGTILSREYLTTTVLGKNMTPFDRAIDMHMSNLRKKLPIIDDEHSWFKTLRGKGYLFIAND